MRIKKNRQLILAGLVLLSGLTACAQSDSEKISKANHFAIENGLKVIRQSQLPDGALRMKGVGDEVKIIPYFANFAAMALLAGDQPEDVERVRRWLDWYVSHQEESGIIYDYFGTRASYPSKGTCDSTDSYASTFIMTLWRYQQVSKIPLEPKFVEAAALALEAIEEVVQSDGLTIAKPDYAIKYLMDNTEVYQGLVEGELLFESAGRDKEAARARRMAKRIARGFSLFWSKEESCFAYGADMNGKLLIGFSKPYPHGLAQLFALAHCVPAPVGLWERVNETFEPDTDGMPAERWLLAAIRCGDGQSIERFREETRKVLRGFTAENVQIHRPAIAILALVDGDVRFPDLPVQNVLRVD